MRVLYSLIIYLAVPVVLLYMAWRSLKDRRWRARWSERFAFTGQDLQPGGVVVHAASVGEVNAAAGLIQALQARPGAAPVNVTSFTPTGSARLTALCGDTLAHAYAPLDLPGSTRRFLDRVQPRLLVIMETEIWPNLYHAASQRGIPIVLVNARLSAASVRAYRRFRWLFGPALGQVRLALAQTEEDARRLAACGLPAERIVVAGNLKYEMQLPPQLESGAAALRQKWGAERPVLIAASTHAEDEPAVIEGFVTLKQTLPGALLILVPRHPERFAAAAAAARRADLRTELYSDGPACSPAADCFVINTMGKLQEYYACSDLAFIGGSFGPTGGHNPLEAAALGLAIITGPNMSSFSEAHAQLRAAGAVLTVNDNQELAQQALALLSSPERRRTMGRSGRRLVESGRGALQRSLDEIDALLS
jgi:3-deoxy-D-manno-octulosonic-acid transferase